jgi:ammonia channel protein AmtB
LFSKASIKRSDSNIDGYTQVYKRYKSREWDQVRFEGWIKNYMSKFEERVITPHAPQEAAVGTLMLWLGWLFFNAGSSGALTEGAYVDAERAIMNTILAPCASGVCTLFTKKYITHDNLDVSLDFFALTNGILAGLVAVTASCA